VDPYPVTICFGSGSDFPKSFISGSYYTGILLFIEPVGLQEANFYTDPDPTLPFKSSGSDFTRKVLPVPVLALVNLLLKPTDYWQITNSTGHTKNHIITYSAETALQDF
jgi:hypothetical protein